MCLCERLLFIGVCTNADNVVVLAGTLTTLRKTIIKYSVININLQKSINVNSPTRYLPTKPSTDRLLNKKSIIYSNQ